MTATTSTTVQTEADAAATKIWAEQWWPLGFAAHTSRAAPVAVTLLGAPLVVWWDDSAGAWRCTLDRCSHRLAPLSEGRVTSDGCIECPYHGWAFDGQGHCVRVPQQEEGSAPCRSRRAAVLALPIMEAQGVIWVWGGGLFESAAVTPPEESGPALVDVLERPGVEHSDYSRDLHMDWSTLCENVMDPAHLPFTHHKTISRRSKAAPISFGALENFSHTGFTAVRQTAGGPGRLTFRAPLLVLAETHRGPDSYSDWNVVYAVPTEPGRCRLLVRVVFEVSKLPIPLKWVLSFAFTKQPTWWTHLGTHQILEDDNPFLHAQGHAYRAGHATKLAPDWKRRLYMPTASDGMVVAFHRWLDAYSDGEGALWSRVAPTTETPAAAGQQGGGAREVSQPRGALQCMLRRAAQHTHDHAPRRGRRGARPAARCTFASAPRRPGPRGAELRRGAIVRGSRRQDAGGTVPAAAQRVVNSRVHMIKKRSRRRRRQTQARSGREHCFTRHHK